MTTEVKKQIKRDIKWLKHAIKTFGNNHENTFCYCWSKLPELPLMEIAARYLRIKGLPLKLSYGSSTITRDCYISTGLIKDC